MFTAATGLAILHVLDDAFIGKQPGTTAGDHLLAAGALLVVLTPWSTKRSDFTGMLAMIGGVAPGKLGAHSQVPIGPASR